MYKNFAWKVTFIKDIFTSQGCVVPKVQDVIQNHNWIRTHPHSSEHQGLPKTGRLSFLKIRAFSIVSVATGKKGILQGFLSELKLCSLTSDSIILVFRKCPTKGQVISLNLVFRNSFRTSPWRAPFTVENWGWMLMLPSPMRLWRREMGQMVGRLPPSGKWTNVTGLKGPISKGKSRIRLPSNIFQGYSVFVSFRQGIFSFVI